jgi:transposase
LGRWIERRNAALVGVAPFNRDSGKLKGKRAIWGSGGDARAVLYVCALVAIRRNASMDRIAISRNWPK